jgi:uncharacterized protein HemX
VEDGAKDSLNPILTILTFPAQYSPNRPFKTKNIELTMETYIISGTVVVAYLILAVPLIWWITIRLKQASYRLDKFNDQLEKPSAKVVKQVLERLSDIELTADDLARKLEGHNRTVRSLQGKFGALQRKENAAEVDSEPELFDNGTVQPQRKMRGR